ncbi:cysteine-rich CWC family protein [Oceanospirillum beijerinckii]|uniref:cysteine-rich CWC family protein n=1 Tax=Oceanospirillum beijerinckii TaxID=64976 RepID=UPI0005631419|nr:cysteine-rich CWC family protein [Oceanospirillum beijerinckii]
MTEVTLASTPVAPLVCPICQQNNDCLNLACGDTDKACWCNHPDITFPQDLLDQVPAELKRKACICRNCVEAYQQQVSYQLG